MELVAHTLDELVEAFDHLLRRFFIELRRLLSAILGRAILEDVLNTSPQVSSEADEGALSGERHAQYRAAQAQRLVEGVWFGLFGLADLALVIGVDGKCCYLQ